MAEHSGRYEQLARKLVGQGYHVYAHDHRGHGFTAKSKSQLGHFDNKYGWRLVVEDLKTVNTLIRDKYIGTPVILFAHSMGSFITQKCLTKYPNIADGVILSGSTVPNTFLLKAAAILAKYEKKKNGPMSRCRIVDFLTFYPYNKAFRPNRTGSDWLSRDQAKVDAYEADSRCGFVSTAQMWIDFSTGLLELYKKESHSRLPSHIPYMVLSGDRDPVGNNGKGVKRLHKRLLSYGVKHAHLKLYPEGRHEMLNEINCEEVEKDILDWIKLAVLKEHNTGKKIHKAA